MDEIEMTNMTVNDHANNEDDDAEFISSSEDEQRSCWVCFATEEDDETAAWVKPCSCRGTTKWVHQMCLQRWVDEKQKGNTAGKVTCPQCNTEYIIVFPSMGPIVYVLDTIDNIVSRSCPFMAAGIVVSSIYWSAVTYGAVTIMQIAGQKEGLDVMEQADPLALLIGLPTIPIMLIMAKMIRWEDAVLNFIRRHSYKIPLLKHILPAAVEEPRIVDIPPVSDPVAATRVLCSALLMPSAAAMIGKLLFHSVQSNFNRTLLGGAVFICVKGILRIYHKQKQYVRQLKREILDYTQPLSTDTTEDAEESS